MSASSSITTTTTSHPTLTLRTPSIPHDISAAEWRDGLTRERHTPLKKQQAHSTNKKRRVGADSEDESTSQQQQQQQLMQQRVTPRTVMKLLLSHQQSHQQQFDATGTTPQVPSPTRETLDSTTQQQRTPRSIAASPSLTQFSPIHYSTQLMKPVGSIVKKKQKVKKSNVEMEETKQIKQQHTARIPKRFSSPYSGSNHPHSPSSLLTITPADLVSLLSTLSLISPQSDVTYLHEVAHQCKHKPIECRIRKDEQNEIMQSENAWRKERERITMVETMDKEVEQEEAKLSLSQIRASPLARRSEPKPFNSPAPSSHLNHSLSFSQLVSSPHINPFTVHHAVAADPSTSSPSAEVLSPPATYSSNWLLQAANASFTSPEQQSLLPISSMEDEDAKLDWPAADTVPVEDFVVPSTPSPAAPSVDPSSTQRRRASNNDYDFLTTRSLPQSRRASLHPPSTSQFASPATTFLSPNDALRRRTLPPSSSLSKPVPSTVRLHHRGMTPPHISSVELTQTTPFGISRSSAKLNGGRLQRRSDLHHSLTKPNFTPSTPPLTQIGYHSSSFSQEQQETPISHLILTYKESQEESDATGKKEEDRDGREDEYGYEMSDKLHSPTISQRRSIANRASSTHRRSLVNEAGFPELDSFESAVSEEIVPIAESTRHHSFPATATVKGKSFQKVAPLKKAASGPLTTMIATDTGAPATTVNTAIPWKRTKTTMSETSSAVSRTSTSSSSNSRRESERVEVSADQTIPAPRIGTKKASSSRIQPLSLTSYKHAPSTLISPPPAKKRQKVQIQQGQTNQQTAQNKITEYIAAMHRKRNNAAFERSDASEQQIDLTEDIEED